MGRATACRTVRRPSSHGARTNSSFAAERRKRCASHVIWRTWPEDKVVKGVARTAQALSMAYNKDEYTKKPRTP
eukprot:scaffold374_cov380-Prasinococcus_capsulatus_cf.AAC.2